MSATMVKLELDLRDAVRELRQSQSRADALEKDCSARLSTRSRKMGQVT